MYLHIYKKTNSIFIHFQYISSTNINESTARATRSQRSALRSLPTVDRARRPGGSSALRCVAGGSFSECVCVAGTRDFNV